MANTPTKKQLESKVKSLKKELSTLEDATALTIKVKKTDARFTRIKNPKGKDGALCEFFMQVDITSTNGVVYIPLSIASGKKPMGFIYSIEGTAKGEIDTANVEVRGAGVTQVTVGTILYAKIPAKTAASFRFLVEIFGVVNNTYSISIDTINCKRAPSDARYKKFDVALKSAKLIVS